MFLLPRSGLCFCLSGSQPKVTLLVQSTNGKVSGVLRRTSIHGIDAIVSPPDSGEKFSVLNRRSLVSRPTTTSLRQPLVSDSSRLSHRDAPLCFKLLRNRYPLHAEPVSTSLRRSFSLARPLSIFRRLNLSPARRLSDNFIHGQLMLTLPKTQVSMKELAFRGVPFEADLSPPLHPRFVSPKRKDPSTSPRSPPSISRTVFLPQALETNPRVPSDGPTLGLLLIGPNSSFNGCGARGSEAHILKLKRSFVDLRGSPQHRWFCFSDIVSRELSTRQKLFSAFNRRSVSPFSDPPSVNLSNRRGLFTKNPTALILLSDVLHILPASFVTAYGSVPLRASFRHKFLSLQSLRRFGQTSSKTATDSSLTGEHLASGSSRCCDFIMTDLGPASSLEKHRGKPFWVSSNSSYMERLFLWAYTDPMTNAIPVSKPRNALVSISLTDGTPANSIVVNASSMKTQSIILKDWESSALNTKSLAFPGFKQEIIRAISCYLHGFQTSLSTLLPLLPTVHGSFSSIFSPSDLARRDVFLSSQPADRVLERFWYMSRKYMRFQDRRSMTPGWIRSSLVMVLPVSMWHMIMVPCCFGAELYALARRHFRFRQTEKLSGFSLSLGPSSTYRTVKSVYVWSSVGSLTSSPVERPLDSFRWLTLSPARPLYFFCWLFLSPARPLSVKNNICFSKLSSLALFSDEGSLLGCHVPVMLRVPVVGDLYQAWTTIIRQTCWSARIFPLLRRLMPSTARSSFPSAHQNPLLSLVSPSATSRISPHPLVVILGFQLMDHSWVDCISIASKFTSGLFLYEFQLHFFDVCFNLCLWIARVSSRPSCDLPFQGRNAPAFQVQVGFIKTIRRLKIFVRQCLLEWRPRYTRPAHYLFERPPVADELKSSRAFSFLLSSLGATLTTWRASSLLLLSFNLCCFRFCSFVIFTHVSTSVPDWLSISECPQPIA